MSSHADLEKLCSMAKQNGASGAAVLAAHLVVLDPRVRLKCMVPMCPNYGRNLMCPPNVPALKEFSTVLKNYMHAILVQYPISVDDDFIQGIKDRTLEEVYQNDKYSPLMVSNKKGFSEVMAELEKEALSMGYRFAAAFEGGPCRLCEECVGQGSGEPCRHPFRSRPSMEAMGIDVFQTAQNAGLPFEIPPKDRPVWTGLLLVD